MNTLSKTVRAEVILGCDLDISHRTVTMPVGTFDETDSGHTDISCPECGGQTVVVARNYLAKRRAAQ